MPIPGSNIALLRRQMNMSQRSLAKAAGVDYSTLSRLENGVGGYSAESLARIATVLNVSTGALFADPGVVEAAALGMREVPVLTPAQLKAWKGLGEAEYTDRQRFLHTSLRTTSTHCFAIVVSDEVNAPIFIPGDELIFDANKHPALGKVVIAQGTGDTLYIGRLRRELNREGDAPLLAVVPESGLYTVLSRVGSPELTLRGVLAEHRRIVA